MYKKLDLKLSALLNCHKNASFKRKSLTSCVKLTRETTISI